MIMNICSSHPCKTTDRRIREATNIIMACCFYWNDVDGSEQWTMKKVAARSYDHFLSDSMSEMYFF